MENIGVIRKLMAQLFSCFYSSCVPSFENILAQDSYVPCGCITEDIFRKILTVSATKLELIKERWRNFIAIYHLKILSSHQMYLEYIMFACITENGFCDDIFDSFLSAPALLIAFNIETLEKTGVNFCELSLDIFMVFYKNVLREQFCSHGGFERFTIYLQQEYLAWECYLNDGLDDSNVPINNNDHFLENIINLINKELGKAFYEPESIAYEDIKKSLCLFLAKEVLSTTKVRLPPIPSEADLNSVRNRKLTILEETEKRCVASKSKMIACASNSETTACASKSETTASASKSETKASASKSETKASASKSETKASASKSETTQTTSKSEAAQTTSISEKTESAPKYEKADYASKSETTAPVSKSETVAPVLQRCESSDVDSQMSILIERKANTSWCDNIVAAVINYNKSKNSSVNVNKRLQEVDEMMDNLKNNIKSFVDILEDWKKE